MVRVTVQMQDVLELLDDVQRAGQNTRRPMRDIATRLRSDILLNFRTGGTFPQAWKRSQRVEKYGGQTLVHKGTLRNSMHARSAVDEAAAGTDVIYGGIHQFGGLCGRGHAVAMPARPFLPVDENGRLRPRTERWTAERLLRHLTDDGDAA